MKTNTAKLAHGLTTWLGAAAMALLVAGCSTTPNTHPELVNLESRLSADMRADDIRAVAGQELQEAERRLDRARLVLADDGVSDGFMHQLYLADRWLDLAEAKADLARTERRAASLADQRDEIVLKARLSNAQLARIEAEAEAMLARQQASGLAAERDIASAEARRQASRAQSAEQQALSADQQARAAEQEALAARESAGEAYLQAEEARRRAADSDQARSIAEMEAQRAQNELAELRSVVAELNAQPTDRGLVLTLNDVLFEFDRATLTPGGERQLQKVAAFLRDHPERQVSVEGFTDSVGAEGYNQMLSQQRAAAVERTLVDAGVDRQRIQSEGFGEAFPVATNDTEAGRQQNRRVEVVISFDESAVEEKVAFTPADDF